MRHHVNPRPLDSQKPVMFFRKYFNYFRMKFTVFFSFFDSWYLIKYLLTSGVCFVDRRQFWVHKADCFPRSQSISIKDIIFCFDNKSKLFKSTISNTTSGMKFTDQTTFTGNWKKIMFNVIC